MLASPSIGMKAAGVEGMMNAQRNRRYRNEIATGREEDPPGTRAVSHRRGVTRERARQMVLDTKKQLAFRVFGCDSGAVQ